LFTEIINEKYNAQRAMMSNGALFYRCMKARDTITASNFNFVYVYKKAGDCESIKASDITLEEWSEWANSVWRCNVSGFKHTTPMSYEMTRRLVKLYSNPLDTVLDCFGGTGTTNEAAIKSHRNAIGIELSKDFYDKGLERFSLWEDDVFETDDSTEAMIQRFNEQLAIGKQSKENAEKAKEEKKILTQKKKDIRAEIKELETQLKALGVKAKEIKEIKDNSLRLFND
jgi:site-specific DNA-methyltransferase (adenine-specific)